ncbi:nucleotide sugar dehydrogenase [uncultured Thermanaerothrix sp.]|uniref:nucleotide sugar dehydrogenase n=1 Tax=uncultured Thermanaerothrix sp. TaxID=1195149 RepID=UPI00260C596D|nr:nucleotide sugar dehydrogenase [uncultured Thermanaerothrix sp.]
MHIAILGLGYVGCVSLACFARDGHHVIGVDINPAKVQSICAGKSPLTEPGLEELLSQGVNAGLIQATEDVTYAVHHADVVMICVGTPTRDNGSLDLTYVERVCRDIGQAMRAMDKYIVVAVRSTILPGYAQEHLIPILESASGKRAGIDFGFCINPEFLREGSAIWDFDHPPYTLIGEIDNRSGESLASLYAHIPAPLYRVPLGIAEMVKYASNAFHALKIVFANEIGNVCQAYGIDSHEVMRIFVQDTKLNISPLYLKPGFAFGGSCLGKDLRSLLYAARVRDVHLPLLESILASNQLQVQKAVDMLLRLNKRRIGLIGLSFKPGTDDLRESPSVELAERLIGKGFSLFIYDREVALSRLIGSNREYIERVIPHLNSLLYSLEETVLNSEVVVVTKRLDGREEEYLFELLKADHVLVDLVRLDLSHLKAFRGTYYGIAW